jgi:hypothetical protein
MDKLTFLKINMKKLTVLFVLIFSLFTLYGQSSKNVLKHLVVDAENLHQECSTFLLVKVEVDKKGYIDSIRVITGGNTLFAQNIRNGFLNLKMKKEMISKKPVIVFFAYQNITEGEGFDPSKCLDLSYYPLWANQEQADCIFVGPFVVISGIR